MPFREINGCAVSMKTWLYFCVCVCFKSLIMVFPFVFPQWIPLLSLQMLESVRQNKTWAKRPLCHHVFTNFLQRVRSWQDVSLNNLKFGWQGPANFVTLKKARKFYTVALRKGGVSTVLLIWIHSCCAGAGLVGCFSSWVVRMCTVSGCGGRQVLTSVFK